MTSTNNSHHQKVHPIITDGSCGVMITVAKPSLTTSTSTSGDVVDSPISSPTNNISSKPINNINRKAFVIDNFDKSLEMKNLDESSDDFSWVPKSPLTSETQYKPKSARNRYDQAFRVEKENSHYYKQAAVNHIINHSSTTNNNTLDTTMKNDEKSNLTKPKPKSAPPTTKRGDHISDNSRRNSNPFSVIKGILNMCKNRNHHDVIDHKDSNGSEKKSKSSTTAQACQQITVEKTQVVVFDNKAVAEQQQLELMPPSPQRNRRIKCGGFNDDDGDSSINRVDQPIIVPLYYHVMNAQHNNNGGSSSGEAAINTGSNSRVIGVESVATTHRVDASQVSDLSISDIQEL